MDDSYKGEKKRLGKSDIIDAAMLAALSILALGACKIGLGTDPAIANKIKVLRGFEGGAGVEDGTRGREISKFLVENLAALLCRD